MPTAIAGFTRGLGRHMWDVRRAGLIRTLKYFTIAQYIYTFLTAAVKLAFLFFYYRIFPRHLKTIRYFVTFGVVFVTVAPFVLVFLTIFSCSPLGRAWEATSPRHCWHQSLLPWLSAALSTSTDLYVLLLPVRPLWSLNTTTRKRVRLAIVFSLGILYARPVLYHPKTEWLITRANSALAASLARLVMTRVLADSPDTTWQLSRISQWALTCQHSTVEANTGIICACLPLLPALFDKLWPKNISFTLYKRWSNGSRPKSSCPAEESELSLNRHQHQALQQQAWQYSKTSPFDLEILPSAKYHQHCSSWATVDINADANERVDAWGLTTTSSSTTTSV
ncbi:uncharacterized protein DSM5745_10242 [Aspergillus mulundensis]|uniref:Rhodopsin domain-containing protein n=1 Tax=Aspergillus mulundensis TaxID=1810919 RepID=A0A3D8QN44_9EURO|nr:hypothetical protein DSM5745_10242 [Aspergillus mulundensis]RDW63131.1 hypothetical protein DSM5745_10242 [Aspergillus mulundensis]